MSTTIQQVQEGHGTRGYRAYVLAALLMVSTMNFVDRMLINVVGEAIRVEFGFSNFLLGFIGGPAFAILYSLLGLPIARLADRTNRISVVAIGTALFSVMTALCGLVMNFWQLLLARIGVGIGEAAVTSPSHSAISDYFPSDRRATALAIFSLGVPVGSTIAAVGGGWLTQNVDWRAAFFILGAPGILLAILLKLTVKEPPRPTSAKTSSGSSLGETVRFLASKPSFWHVAIGGGLVSFAGFGLAQFKVPYLVRTFDLGATLPEEIGAASYIMALSGGIATGLGVFLGGFLADRLARTHGRVFSWLPAMGLVLAIPLYAVCFLQEQFALALAMLLIAPVFHYLYLGPMFAVAQGVAAPRMRATATATLLLLVNLIGYALGPPFVGAANDFFTSMILQREGLEPATCLVLAVEAAIAETCARAESEGIRYAMVAVLIGPLWGIIHFLLAGRTLKRDMGQPS